MKPCQRFLLQCAVSFLVPPILFNGCSLIGLGIGAMSDGSRKGGEAVSGLAELRGLAKGTGIVLITHGGSKIEGDFFGMDELNRRDYDRLYLAAIETLEVRDRLPRPADTISFAHYGAPGGRVRGQFRGLNPGSIVLWWSGGEYSLTGLRNLDGDSARPLDLVALRALADEGLLPYITTGILVRRSDDTISVPVEDIARIEQDRGGSGKLTGFLVGAAIDAVVLIVYIVEVNKTEREISESCSKSVTSCGSNQAQR